MSEVLTCRTCGKSFNRNAIHSCSGLVFKDESAIDEANRWELEHRNKVILDLQAKLELAKAFIKAECYCEMGWGTPMICENCQFLTTI
jgi:hypothetical protein